MVTSRILETPSGSGTLRVAGQHLAQVFYHLQVRVVLVGGEPTPGPGALEITGEMTVSQDEPMQAQVLRRVGSGERLTLHLGDGRHLEITASPSLPPSAAFRILPVGPAVFGMT